MQRHFSFEWLRETVNQLEPDQYAQIIKPIKNDEFPGPQACAIYVYSERYTMAHLAAKGDLFRLLHEVFIDTYSFDVDFYQPFSRLTLLHVVGKY